jgi:hypothetical protein
LSPADLDDLARLPAARMDLAVTAGDPEVAGSVWEDIERGFQSNLRAFAAWERGSTRFLEALGRPTHDGPRPGADQTWLLGSLDGIQAGDVERVRASHTAAIQDLVSEGDVSGARRLYADLEGSYRRLHDAHCDMTAWLWSAVYRTGGPDALEECFRGLARTTLMRWMERDLASSPPDRIREYAGNLVANFATIRVEEHADRFRIIQDPCGTCSRRIRAGCYQQPMGLAVVTEKHSVTYGRGDVPIYRCHVAVMHWLMPIELIGVPWPMIRCPPGLETGPCRIDMMKDPRAIPGGEGQAR